MNSGTSFEESIKVANCLLKEAETHGYALQNESAVDSIKELLTSMAGARGFFVALLSGEWSFGDEVPDSLIELCTSAGPIADELLAKNLVMSSCTRVHHLRSGNNENASGSERVISRTSFIIENQTAPSQSLKNELLLVKEALDEACRSRQADNKFGAFLVKWKYDEEQLSAARQTVTKILSKIE